MAQVTLTVNGKPYPVACDDGQEDRIRQLGQYIDNRVGDFAKRFGQIGEARLLLLAALMITDELAEASETLRRERVRPGNSSAEQERSIATESVVAAGIDSLAARIEAVAARLEGTI
jgi:cell division protein ZapA